jgi:hypothetical protein
MGVQLRAARQLRRRGRKRARRRLHAHRPRRERPGRLARDMRPRRDVVDGNGAQLLAQLRELVAVARPQLRIRLVLLTAGSRDPAVAARRVPGSGHCWYRKPV